MKKSNGDEANKNKGMSRRTTTIFGTAERHPIKLTVNGKLHELMVGKDVNPSHTLSHTLRETLELTGTKIACGHGACGSCTVLMDGEPILSCMTLTVECDGKSITTIEGLKNRETGELDALQQAFIDYSAFQCGFCTPGIIMSAKALLNKNSAPSEEDLKKALAGHYCRCISHYQVMKAVMAAVGKRGNIEAIAMTKAYRHIGKGTPRVDAEEIVTGNAKFIGDLKLPNMLFGKALRSPYPHANIRTIDTSEAEKLPGVEAVLTYKNVPDWKAGFPSHVGVLDSKVRFVGDAMALVAAETEEIAEKALELIDVEYEPLPAVYEVEEAMKPDAPHLYSEMPGNIAPRGFFFFGPTTLQEIVMGDVERGFKEADFITEGKYAYENTPNPLPPEPPGAIVRWEGPSKLTVWSATQSPYLVQKLMTRAMGVIDIQSIASHCGGSFGSKNCATKPIFYAAALAKAVGKGRPVKVVYTKEEHLMAYVVRFGSRIHGKVGIKKDGTVTAFSGKWLINTGHYTTSTQGMVAVGLGEAQIMLRCTHWNLQPHVILTNRTATGAVRGFGGQELKSAFLPILMTAMEKADLDPVEFFKKNFAKAGDGYYWRDGRWWVCRGVDYSKAIDKGAQVFGWKDKWKGWNKPTAVNGAKRIGVGCGVHGNADAGEDRSEAYVRLLPYGTAVLQVCAAESGGGQRSSLRKMVAEVLNLPLDRINLTDPNTLVNPFEHGLAGSRGTYAVGSSVTRAAEDARQKLFKSAAPMLGANPEDLDTKDGFVYVKSNPQARLPWVEAIGDIERTITGFGVFEPDHSMPNFFMTFVEVEVDVEMGKTELLRVTGATDVGQIIDPLALEGQLHGALGAAGIDSALFEETVMDKTSGHILNGNMIDYKWRTYLGLPIFQNVVLETPLPTHVYGAIGVGEITTSPGPSAILMAVSNAIGKKVTDYPATPDKILKALGKI